MLLIRIAKAILPVCIITQFAIPAYADQDKDDVLAIADRALERITAEDFKGLTDLMLDTATIHTGTHSDGEYRVGTRTFAEQREATTDADLVERGFEPTILVSGPIATVWYPYDLYSNGEWSHCGIDIFNLVRTNDGWRIAALLWSTEQPPACEPHPDGPPRPVED